MIRRTTVQLGDERIVIDDDGGAGRLPVSLEQRFDGDPTWRRSSLDEESVEHEATTILSTTILSLAVARGVKLLLAETDGDGRTVLRYAIADLGVG
jgi:hypothetical protein